MIPLHAFDHGPPTGVRLGIAAVAGLLATLVMTLVMWAQRYGYVPPYVAAAALWRRPPNEVSRPAADAAHLAAGVLAGVVYEAANVAYENAGESLGLGDVHFGSVTSLSEVAFLAALVGFLYGFFAWLVFPRYGGNAYRAHPAAVRRQWAVSAVVYGVALLTALTVVYRFGPV